MFHPTKNITFINYQKNDEVNIAIYFNRCCKKKQLRKYRSDISTKKIHVFCGE